MSTEIDLVDLAPKGKTDDSSVRRQLLVDLFDSNYDMVFRFCLARCGDVATAEDIASETFYAAATSLGSGAERSIGQAWLFLVARRRLADHWRKVERERRRVLKLLELGEAVGQHNVQHDSPSQTEEVLTVLRSLPPRQRSAIALRYLDDHSVSEVAEVLQVPYRAAESLLARGRRSFVAAWEER